ncbi:hypothetical protein CEB3_c41530 [Peptococcaceae bacterium CEB3]|nr:hypothetical protein CEB3_c41530 [Peptococcaceae bacterium CEB3]
MDNKLIFRLKEFYTLEILQVAFYEAQANSATDEYYKKAFEKIVGTEQGHVDYFADKIVQANEKVPSVAGSVFQLAGSVVGETMEFVGKYNTCMFGVALENKATEMYRTFIDETNIKNYVKIKDTLFKNLLDEEFHAYWLRDYATKHPNA